MHVIGMPGNDEYVPGLDWDFQSLILTFLPMPVAASEAVLDVIRQGVLSEESIAAEATRSEKGLEPHPVGPSGEDLALEDLFDSIVDGCWNIEDVETVSSTFEVFIDPLIDAAEHNQRESDTSAAITEQEAAIEIPRSAEKPEHQPEDAADVGECLLQAGFAVVGLVSFPSLYSIIEFLTSC